MRLAKFIVGLMGLLLVPSLGLAENTTNWATWVIPTETPLIFTDGGADYSIGRDYAIGTTGTVIDPQTGNTIDMILSGEIAWFSSDYGFFYDRAGFNSSVVGNAPEGPVTQISQTGFTSPEYQAHTLQFSAPVENAVMALRSLGRSSMQGGFVFSQPFIVLDQNAAGVTSGGNGTTGYTLTGNEGNGLIQFLGTYDSISCIAAPPEAAVYFTVGLTTPDNPSAGETVLVADLFSTANGATRPESFGSFGGDSGAGSGGGSGGRSIGTSLLSNLLADASLLPASITNLAENLSAIDGSITISTERSLSQTSNVIDSLLGPTAEGAAFGSVSQIGNNILARDIPPSMMDVLDPTHLSVSNMATTAIGAMQSGYLQSGYLLATFDANNLLTTANISATAGSTMAAIDVEQYTQISNTIVAQNASHNSGQIDGQVELLLQNVNAVVANVATTSIGAMQSGSIAAQWVGTLGQPQEDRMNDIILALVGS